MPTPQGVAPTYDFAKFSQKLHEIERIWTPGGGGGGCEGRLDPPLKLSLLALIPHLYSHASSPAHDKLFRFTFEWNTYRSPCS